MKLTNKQLKQLIKEEIQAWEKEAEAKSEAWDQPRVDSRSQNLIRDLKRKIADCAQRLAALENNPACRKARDEAAAAAWEKSPWKKAGTGDTFKKAREKIGKYFD